MKPIHALALVALSTGAAASATKPVAFDPRRPGEPVTGSAAASAPVAFELSPASVGGALAIRVDAAALGTAKPLAFPVYASGGGFGLDALIQKLKDAARGGSSSRGSSSHGHPRPGGATPVPEPAPFALFGIALAVFVAARRYARPRAG